MQTFKVEQAIFASSDRGSMKGYQLVARSPGVDRAISQSLCRWAPTQVPGDAPKAWTISYFPINDEMVAVTRTVLGGPEYSSRGGFQVITMILLLRNEQFHAYSCNPILVVKTALAVGLLRMPLNVDCDQLPVASLPSQPLLLPPESSSQDAGLEDQVNASEAAALENIADMIRHAQRIALIGHHDPIAVVERLIPKLSLEARREFSFTTGLLPTVRRPFQAHFLPSADLARQRTLDSQSIARIELN